MFLTVQLLSIVRVPLAILFAYLLMNYEWSALTFVAIGFVILGAIELSDFLDGFLARRYGVASELGATLDPYTDSVSRLIVYWSLAQINLAFALVPMVMAIRDITVSYCRILLARSNQSVGARWSGKAKAVVQAVGAFILVLTPALPLLGIMISSDLIVAVVSVLIMVITAGSAIEYMRDALRTI